MVGMKVSPLFNRRIRITEESFAELVAWKLPNPIAGSVHGYKYRLAFVVKGACVCAMTTKQARAIIGTEIRRKNATLSPTSTD